VAEVPLLKVSELVKEFPLAGGLLARPHARVRAVNGVSFAISRGETFALVGESGCGKTTLGRLILGLIKPSGGDIEFDGQNFQSLSANQMLRLRRRMQIIFQDPYSSLDPRMKVDTIVTEPLYAIKRLPKNQRRKVAAELLEKVGMQPVDLDKYPHEFSGGQRQRIGIARALCVQPELIVADEPVSALERSVSHRVTLTLRLYCGQYPCRIPIAKPNRFR
jgi:ABC-type glutathione transport system ATPase component